MAVASKYDYTGIRTVPTTGLTTAAESALAITPLDTAGISRSTSRARIGARSAPRERQRAIVRRGGHYVSTPSLRASYSLAGSGSRRSPKARAIDSIAHSDVTAQFTPLSFVSVLGRSVGRADIARR